MTLGLSSAVAAQESSVVHVVSYIEVEPAAAEQVAELLASHEATSRDDAGNLSFKALQRIGRPNHFALIESWSTADSHIPSHRRMP